MARVKPDFDKGQGRTTAGTMPYGPPRHRVHAMPKDFPEVRGEHDFSFAPQHRRRHVQAIKKT
jgi:hypothetical protein